MHVIEFFISALLVYLGIGFVFALVFIAFGMRSVDSITTTSSAKFRALTLPGTTMLWPIMLAKWIRA